MLKELAQTLDISPSGISQTVDVLVKHGYVERFIPPHDRRSVGITTTDKAMELCKKFSKYYRDTMAQITRKLDQDKLAVCLEVLETLQGELRVDAPVQGNN